MTNSKPVRARHIRAGSTEMTSTSEPKDDASPEVQDQKKIDRINAFRRSLTKTPDKVADSNLSYRNWQVPGGMKLFPNDWRCRVCDLYYPHAAGGPLFIDTPSIKFDVDRCERKLKVFSENGIRYTYIANNETHQQALERLEKFERTMSQ